MLTEVQAVRDRLEGQTALSDKTVAAPTVTVGLLGGGGGNGGKGGKGARHEGQPRRRQRTPWPRVRRVGSPVLVPPTGARA